MKLADLFERADPASLDIDSIKPEKKDIDRAEGLRFKGSAFHGDNTPWSSEASKMAKLIKDPAKLVRRAKAVVQVYDRHHNPSQPTLKSMMGDKDRDVWTPFKDALKAMGFGHEQISKIEKS